MITVVGEALLDMVQPAPGDLYRALPAGGPLNVAVALRRLGHHTAMMARFSSGRMGQRLRRFAAECDLDLSASVTTDEPATLAFATVDDLGRAAYDFYVRDTADWAWTDDELAALPPGTDAVHTGSLAAALMPGASRIAALWKKLASEDEVLLTFDPNVRPALAGPRDVAVRRTERFVSLSHVVKASDEDLAWLYPDRDPLDAMAIWARSGPALAVLTRGADGCIGIGSDGSQTRASAPAVAVVDTIGAGDAFQAGLLAGLAETRRLTPQAVRGLTAHETREILERAATVAAMTCARPGADPPTRPEYDAFVSARRAEPPTGASAEGGTAEADSTMGELRQRENDG